LKNLTEEENIKRAKEIVNTKNKERLWRQSVEERICKGEHVPQEEREKYEKFLRRQEQKEKQQKEQNARIKNDPDALKKQREKQTETRRKERNEGFLYEKNIVDLTKKKNCKKAEKTNEEKRLKKGKHSKTKASVKRKANVSKEKNTLKRRKINVSSKTAKGRCRLDSDVNDMNLLRRPLRKSTRLSTVNTYNESSSEDEEMEVKNNLLPVLVDNEDSIAKGKSTTLSIVILETTNQVVRMMTWTYRTICYLFL
jgi:hypothetical protein